MSIKTPSPTAKVTDAMVDQIAETMWQAEWKRAGNGGPRKVPWTEVAERDRERYRFVAREVAALTAAIGAGGQAVAWRYRGHFHDKPLPWQYTDAKWLVDRQAEYGEEIEPLYAHPSPSLPLRNEVERAAISPSDPSMIIAGIKQFGLAADGSDLRDLEAAINRLRAGAQEGWRKMDIAPKDGAAVLLCFDHHPVSIGRYEYGTWVYAFCMTEGGDSPTGWRHLPAAPSPAKEGGR